MSYQNWGYIIAGVLVGILILTSNAYAEFCAVNVTSEPSGARVYVDGEYVGDTPILYVIGDPAIVKVEVVKEGYMEWKEEINVPYNEIVSLMVTLKPLQEKSLTNVDGVKEERIQGEKPIKGVCGPVTLLVLALLPLIFRRLG